MVVRAEFLALEDCHFYAQRITAIRDGMPTERLQAYANTRDSEAAIARNASASGNYGRQVSAYPVSAVRVETPQQDASDPGKIMTATPATAAYQFSTHPMISGEVVSVNDHQLVVDTYQGQQVGMVMDSRTVLPGMVEPGSLVRAEFAPMKDGRYYAKRVSTISSGVASREQAFAHTRDSDAVIAQNTTECGCYTGAVSSLSVHTETPAVERREIIPAPQAVIAASEPAPIVEEKTLPQTASNQPLVGLLGLLSLGAAGALRLTRGFRSA
jgi:hypothetical protein